MPTLHTYQLLDKELPAILMAVLMTLTFLVVLAVIFLKRCSSDDKGRMAPLVFIETIELYFPKRICIVCVVYMLCELYNSVWQFH